MDVQENCTSVTGILAFLSGFDQKLFRLIFVVIKLIYDICIKLKTNHNFVIGVHGRIQPGMNGLQIKLSTNFTFTAENPYNSPLYSMPSDELNLVRQS